MRRIAIQLSEEERKTLNCFRQKGVHNARENNRAHILAALDQQVPDQQIREVLGVSSMVIWRTRAAYQQKGLDFALRDEPPLRGPAQVRDRCGCGGVGFGLQSSAGWGQTMDPQTAGGGRSETTRFGGRYPGIDPSDAQEKRLEALAQVDVVRWQDYCRIPGADVRALKTV